MFGVKSLVLTLHPDLRIRNISKDATNRQEGINRPDSSQIPVGSFSGLCRQGPLSELFATLIQRSFAIGFRGKGGDFVDLKELPGSTGISGFSDFSIAIHACVKGERHRSTLKAKHELSGPQQEQRAAGGRLCPIAAAQGFF